MADDYLLVPMHLDAMVLNQLAQATTPFLRGSTMDYSQLEKFGSPEPDPFAGASMEQPPSGIYLHWTLPKALRHGIHKDDGGTDFPFVPNRWLVVRLQSGAPNATKAWVLESDYLRAGDEDKTATSPFVEPTTDGSKPPQPTAIGRVRLLKDFTEQTTPTTPFLQAVGPGNAVFSVFSPGVDNVFAFFDEVKDNNNAAIGKADFTYYVTGWYADPNHDPINHPNLEWVAAEAGQYQLKWNQGTPQGVPQFSFDWLVYADDHSADHSNLPKTLPKKMLVHTLVSGISWDVEGHSPPAQNYPTDIQNKVRVAFGNTAVDALSAIVRLDENNQTEADLLEAFQYNLLDTFDKPGTTEALNMAIREHWYSATPGGTRWTIVPKERSASDTSPPPVVSNDQKKALADLNTKQAELQRQQRLLQSMQWNLFSLWWKENSMLIHQNASSYFDDDNGYVLNWLLKQLAGHTGNQWIFRAGDLVDAAGLCAKLQNGTDPLSASFQSNQLFTDGFANAIGNYTAPPTPELQTAVIDFLNSLLTIRWLNQSDKQHSPQADFSQVTLSPETQSLLSQKPSAGRDLAHLNRRLLEDAYPNEILKAVPRPTCNHPTGTDPTRESWYICKVRAQLNLVAHLSSDTQLARARAANELLDSLTLQNLLLPTQELKAINTEPYYAANDPVILITGLGRSTNFDPIDGLTCRLPSQTVSVDGAGPTPLAGVEKVPSAVPDIHRESFLLSPDLYGQNILSSLPQPGASVRFAPVSFAMEKWQQPWVPLLLDWDVTVLEAPAYTSPKDPNMANLQLEVQFNQEQWQFDGTDYKWIGPTDAGPIDNFDPKDPIYKFDATFQQMKFSGRTFITPQLSFTLADQLKEYVEKHKSRDANLEKTIGKLEGYLETLANQDILSQRLSGMRALMAGRNYRSHIAPFGDIKDLLGDYGHGTPNPYPNAHYSQQPAPWDFAPMAGTFFVINRLTVIDSFGRAVDLMLANYSTNPQIEHNPTAVASQYFYPIAGRNLKAGTAVDPAPGIAPAGNATLQMLQLAPRPAQDSQLSFRLTSNDGQDKDIYHLPDANPVCGWVVPNHLDRSLALYAPDGRAWGELYLSLHAQNRFEPVWQSDPTRGSGQGSIDDISNIYVRKLIQALMNRSDDGSGFYDFLQVIDETLWTINPRGQRQDENLSVLIGRPLAIVRAQLSLKLRGLPYYNPDWWDTFQVDFKKMEDYYPDTPDDGSVPHPPGAFDGGIKNYLWPVRLGSQALRDDGVIGYFVDDPNSADNTFKVFNSVNLPAEIRTDYLKQIGADDNYLKLRFIDDSVAAPDPTQNQVCTITMLVDPRGSIHAFSGLLPVVTLDVPSEFVSPARQNMSYTFRAGPFLTSADELRLPEPAENKGTWSWFDRVINATVPLTKTDDQVRLAATTPIIKEGWLKFTPDSTQDN